MNNPPITYKSISQNLELSQFDAIFLEDLGKNNLMARFDTKYPFNIDALPQILAELAPHYYILEIGGQRNHPYESLYLDTNQLGLYLQHHNKHKNRYKFRFRRYCESGTVFFEIKFKDNRSFTTKTRVSCEDFIELDEELKQFISANSTINPNILRPSLHVFYKRITLVHKQTKMRFTIDQALSFSANERNKPLHKLAIAEVKRPNAKENRFVSQLFKRHKIYPMRVSKYCMGISSLYPDIKSNNYKQKMRMVNKIEA